VAGADVYRYQRPLRALGSTLPPRNGDVAAVVPEADPRSSDPVGVG
jgi:hypothetical protein